MLQRRYLRKIYESETALSHSVGDNTALTVEREEGNIKRRSALRTTGQVLIVAALYATIRYNVFGTVPWSDWPLLVVNKIIAVASLVLLAISTVTYYTRRGKLNGKLIAYAAYLALAHTILSLVLFSEEYYPRFFDSGKVTWNAGLSLLIGSIFMIRFFLNGNGAAAVPSSGRVNGISQILFFSGLHAGLLGYNVWATPETWPGSLPPLTMLSFLIALITCVVHVWCRKSSMTKL